jgi:ATP/maltotriose-dependent transcriptional regulator MalT
VAVAPELLTRTKLHVPRVRCRAVERRDLWARLDSHPGATLVVAGAGFGKTTLLAQWRPAGGQPVAWVSLDEGDNDPVLLWSYILAALDGLDGLDLSDGPDALPAGPPSPDILGTVVPGVLNRLDRSGDAVVLVLDDYHAITNPACHRSVELLVQRLPANVRLVIATRAEPPLGLGRLRAIGQLQVLGRDDLSFSRAEADHLLNADLGLDLSAEAVRVLHERTEGWPAGLYLAYLSLRDAPASDREAAVAEFRGSSRNVVDYLTEVALDTLAPATRDFMVETSILDGLCGPLCDAVTGRHGSGDLLEDLARANHLVVPLDDHRVWYRYHRLLDDLLRDELHRHHPASRRGELHARASEWLAGAGQVGEAIRHAVAAGELERATELIATNYLPTIEWAGYATVAGWLDAFPRPAVVRDARLSVVEAWVMSFLNHPDRAEAALRNALAAGYVGPLPDGASSVEASAALVRAGFPQGDVGDMLAAARRAFEREGRRDSPWKVTVHVQLGWALRLVGRPLEARPLLQRGAALAPLGEQWLDAVGARCLLTWLALDLGDAVRAEDWARDATEIARSQDLSDRRIEGYVQATLGAALVGRGDVDKGGRLLDAGLDRMRDGAQPFLLVEVLVAAATAHRGHGDRRGADGLVAEAQTLVDRCTDPGVLRDKVAAATAGPGARGGGRPFDLTDRELDVLQLLDQGFSKREVADELFVSYNTVHTHARAIYRKLGASSRSEAIARARQRGLTTYTPGGSTRHLS